MSGKICILLLVSLLGMAIANDLFIGSWKEDATKRENLNDYLYYRGTKNVFDFLKIFFRICIFLKV